MEVFRNEKPFKVGLYHAQSIPKDKIYTPRANKEAIFVGSFFDNQEWKIFDIQT
jgi:hypothetical protein